VEPYSYSSIPMLQMTLKTKVHVGYGTTLNPNPFFMLFVTPLNYHIIINSFSLST